MNDTVSAVERPLICPSVKTSRGRSPRPLTMRSAANMFADSKRRAFSRRSVKSAIPVMEVTAMISARNNKRSSPPFQSLRSNLREIRNRLPMGLLSTNFAAALSCIHLILVSIICNHFTSDEPDLSITARCQTLIMSHQDQRRGESFI